MPILKRMANIIQISLFRNKKGRNFLHRITLFPYISLFPNSCSRKGARPLSAVKHRRDNTKAVAESSRRRHGYSHSLTTLFLYCHCCIAEEAPKKYCQYSGLRLNISSGARRVDLIHNLSISSTVETFPLYLFL